MTHISVLDNLRFRIVTMNGKLAASCALLAVLMLLDWAFGVQQFVYYYLESGLTDVPPAYFFTLFPVFLGSFLLTAGIILSAVLLRLRIRHWAKQLSVFAEYQPLYMPAYAGMLFDYSHDHREVYAMLLDLHFRGAIRLKEEYGLLTFEVIDTSLNSLNDAEKLLLDAALEHGGSEVLCQDMFRHHFTPAHLSDHFLDFGLDYKFVKRTDAVLLATISIGGFYTILSAGSKIFAMDQVLSLLHPRYPATILHISILVALSVATVVIILTGFLPRFKSNHKLPHVSTWMHVAGWKYYLQTVYKERMSPAHIFAQDPDEIRDIVPYLVALGILNLNKSDIMRLIDYVDNGGSTVRQTKQNVYHPDAAATIEP